MPVEFSLADEIDDGGLHIVVVSGEIDVFTAPELKERIAAPIDEGHAHVVVDLSEVTFIDSSSLGILIGAHKRLLARAGTFTIVSADLSILNTFKLTGLDSIFDIVGDRASIRLAASAGSERLPPR